MTERTSYAHGEFSWVDLVAHDMTSAMAWYSKLFRWDASKEDTQGGPPYAMFTKSGKPVAGIGQMSDEMKARGIPPTWNSYVQVDDAAAIEAKARDLGATITVPTMKVMDAGWLCFMTDPTGASIAVWQKDQHGGAGLVSEDGAFTWNELATRDPDEARAFYEKLFGWTIAPMGDNPYLMIMNAGKPNGGIVRMGDEQPAEVPAHWMVYFSCDDVDGVASAAKSSGGSLKVEPTSIPPGRFSVVADPQGAVFSLIKPNPPPA